MTVFLGTFGQVELQREFGDVDLRSTINPSDVNATEKRFSFDFEHGQLLTGDQIEITSTDASALDFISSYTDSSVKKFINVDELDGIRLYDTFANAVNGGTVNATALATPADDIPVRVKVANTQARVLASVKSYELSNQRDTVDTTALSDEFKSRVSTLMSGSGRMTCEWQYTGSTTEEVANYLLELQLRTKVGSQFKGKFYLKTESYNPGGSADTATDEIWYEVNGVLTSTAVSFAVGQLVMVTADFITTGPVQMRMVLQDAPEVLQENSDKLLLEQGDNLDLDG